jgi:hypothetical protein
MKTFIYKETKHNNRTRNNRELTIYHIKNNMPVYIGNYEYSTGSTRGAKHEVFNYLMDNGYIPKKYYKSSECDWMGPGYFYGNVEKYYSITEI